jgi:hypothetical protein
VPAAIAATTITAASVLNLAIFKGYPRFDVFQPQREGTALPMDEIEENVTEDDLAAQKPELLPDREAMTVLQPLPPVHGPVDILPPEPDTPSDA